MPYWMTPEIIIAISSIFIALLALFATIWQGLVTRKHNKLTVKPILSFQITLSSHSDKIGICIINKGVGPLILTESIISKAGKSSYLHKKDYIKLFPLLNNPSFHFGIPARNCSILPNENVWLISCSKHKEQDAFIDLMDSEFKGLNIEIKYKSIYDEKFTESCKL